jgi:hypothetical protein
VGRYGGRTVFRAPVWVWIAVAISTALCAAGAIFTALHGSALFVQAGLALMTVVGIGGLVECAVTKVELRHDAIVVRTPWSRRRYPREQIVGVGEGKGVAPALRLADGSWAKMPEIIGGSFGNSVRAWLKAI